MNTQEWCKSMRITSTAKRVDSNPNMEGSDKMDNWRVTLKYPAGRMGVLFSMGKGHNGTAPTAEEVIDCLASDATGVENARSFEEWAGEYGYDPDDRTAKRTYRICVKQAAQLKRFVGIQYDTLLDDIERL